jgi:hypothetical protein
MINEQMSDSFSPKELNIDNRNCVEHGITKRYMYVLAKSAGTMKTYAFVLVKKINYLLPEHFNLLMSPSGEKSLAFRRRL